MPAGRPKGLANKSTRTIKEAIERACQPGACHPDGLAGWLTERANGGIEDRKIFATVVTKIIPAQLQASVQHGGVVVQLGWLAGRSIGRGSGSHGTSAAQLDAVDAQVVEVTMNSDGDLRVQDPKTVTLEAGPAPAGADSDPHPPLEPGVGALE